MNAPDDFADRGGSNPRVMLIGKDETLAMRLLQAMERAGFSASWAKTGTDSLSLKATLRPHVVLMDLTLSDMSGIALLRRLAVARDCGIIVISAVDDEADRIVSLELGADDYMAEPLGLRELVARIRAVHRRVSIRPGARTVPQAASALHIGPIRINVGHRAVHTADGQRLALTSAEFTVLKTLANAAGAAVSRDKLSQAALGRPWRAEDRSVDQLVFNLRQKLPANEGGDALIQSIRGSGYWLQTPDQAPVHVEDDSGAEMAA